MSGLFLLFAGGVWAALLALLAYVLTSRIQEDVLRFVVAALVFGLLLPLPLIDELLGKREFEQLCEANATVKVDREKAVGKTVYLAPTTDTEMKDKWLRIVVKQWRFVELDTGEPVVSYDTLEAAGGRFVKAFAISEGRVPLTFANYYCGPKERPASAQAFAALGIKYVEPPTTK
jgi:hypothetical protein